MVRQGDEQGAGGAGRSPRVVSLPRVPTPREAWPSRHLVLSAVPESVPTSRRWLRETLTRWGLSGSAGRAELVLSELLTNAITHARHDRASVGVLVMFAAETLRIEVRDTDPTHEPEVQAPAPGVDEGGWGLVLVGAYADRWGSRRDDGVKTVWAELEAGSGKAGSS